MSEDITELQRRILELILNDSHRPGAITSVLRGRNFKCTQNDVVQALQDLEQRNLVERVSAKAWNATGRAEDYV